EESDHTQCACKGNKQQGDEPANWQAQDLVTDVEGDSDFAWQENLNGHRRNSKYFSDKHQRFSSAHVLPPLASRKMITVVYLELSRVDKGIAPGDHILFLLH